MEVDTSNGEKRQSLYTPSPHRDMKRPKSEEPDARMRQPEIETAATEPRANIGDILKDLKDLSDDFSQQQAQTRWLLWQTAEKQRQEASTKVSIKNWWKYDLRASKDFETLENYRRTIVEHFATEAGISASKQRTFTFSNYIGRSFSPFCVVDVGDARTKALMLDHMKQTHGGKVTEWTPTSFQADMAGLTSDRSNRQGINGKLVFEPLISTFDKLQSVPLKLAMASVAEIRPDISWKKDWQQQTMFIPDGQGLPSPCLVWVAVDHLHGLARVYYNEDLLDHTQFRDALKRHELSHAARKGWGKGKSKSLTTLEDVGQGEITASFLDLLGLGSGKSSSKGSRNPHSSAMERATKAGLPFRIEARGIKSTEFVKSYNEHLQKLLMRWS